MTLGTYPLVYLPVAAALRRADPAMEETARSLGAGRLATFCRVTLPLIRTAVLGGCVLVVLTVISEYGAFEILRYQTFTTEIFTEFQFDAQAAGALSVPLVCLGLLVLAVDGVDPPPHGDLHGDAARVAAPIRMRRATMPTLAALGVLVVLGVGVPVGHARLLDGPEPAHHASGRGHAGLGDRCHCHLQRAGGVGRRGAGPARRHDDVPAFQCGARWSSSAAPT